MKHHAHHKTSRFWEHLTSWKGIWFHVAGIIAIVWFLVRVVPKPSRAQYPCQQVAMSISYGYIAFWGIMLTGAIVWMRKSKTKFMKTTPMLLAGFVVLFTITGAVFATNYFNQGEPAPVAWTPIPKEPMGVPTGANPGRVVWEWNPDATEQNLTGYWWEEQNNNQSVLDQMVAQGIMQLAGTSNSSQAWQILFSYFNQKHGNGSVSYQPGEKIAIKLNFNNALGGSGDPYKQEDNDRDASPYVVKALLRQLTQAAGVPQDDITIYDASRPIPDWFYNRLYYVTYPADPLVPEFNAIHYVDSTGGATGREQVVASTTKMYFADGTIRTLPQQVVSAKYIIDMPELKRHPLNYGVTLSGKNFFGSFMEPVSDVHPYHLSGMIMGNAAPQVDLFAYKELGGKTILFFGDGTYGTKVDHKTIAKFQMYPFNNDWTNSIFLSQDPVAIDSVMYDFLYTEGTNPCEGSQNYLHQAAVPLPNTYDPEHDGVYLSTSLGVHEHWDPTVSIFSADRYSGPAGDGIDFVACGSQYTQPAVIITTPLEKHLYLFSNDKGEFFTTVIVGKITVEAQVNGDVGTIQKVEFYKDNKLQAVDTETPYTWSWNTKSFFMHTITTVAYFDNTTLSNQVTVLKFF
ncbi:MAG TPA: Ig-like domain-containing protein [Candidatus Thermoplasmatota archaeon]|nr:Ig-like domain-containing protein [Candidatus Thermoplasmatota archaeon]